MAEPNFMRESNYKTESKFQTARGSKLDMPEKSVLIPEILRNKITSISFSSNCNKFYSQSTLNPNSQNETHACSHIIIWFGANVKVFSTPNNQIILEKRKINSKNKQIYWKSYPICYHFNKCGNKIEARIGPNILRLVARLGLDLNIYHTNMAGIMVHNILLATGPNYLEKCIVDCNRIFEWNCEESLREHPRVKIGPEDVIEFSLDK